MSLNEKLDINLLIKSFKVVNIEVFKSYLKEIWLDLTERSEKKKGIDKITFNSYYQLPGILSLRLFSVFNKGHTDYIDMNEFLKGMTSLFCESFEKTSKFIFDFYDFDKDGLIDKEDIRTVLSYIALNNENNNSELQGYLNRVNSQKELYNLLENSFKNVNKEKINYNEFVNIIENTASDIYISILLFLLDKKPFSKTVINEYGKNKKISSPVKISREKTPKLIASPIIHESSLISSVILERESKKRKTLSVVMNESQKERLIKGIGKNQNLNEDMQNDRKKFHSGTLIRRTSLSSFVKPKTESKFSNNSIHKINSMMNNNENEDMIHFIDDDFPENDIEQIPVYRKTKTNLKNIQELSSSHKDIHLNEDKHKAIELMPAYKQNKNNKIDYKDYSETASIKSSENESKNEFNVINLINDDSNSNDNSNSINNFSYESESDDDDGKEVVKYEGYLYKMINNNKLKRLWFKLLHKDLYFYKNDKETIHKGMHNLSGVFLKEEKPEVFNGITFYSFSVIYPKKTRVYYIDNELQYKIWVAKLKLATEYTNLSDIYEITKTLGNGKFGLVKLGINKQTGKNVAIKIMSKKEMTNEDLSLVQTEIEILKICQHPNIIHLYEVFENEEFFYIIMEYCEGGDLFSYLEKRHFHIREDRACQIIHKILTALYYIHSYGIIHRDIKPENILMTSLDNNADIRILDFGLSKILGPGEYCIEPYGTLSYVAPEVLLEKSYNKQVDLWSLGITTYLIVGGSLPFDHIKNDKEIARQTINDPPPFKGNVWKRVSEEAIDFIKKLLVKDPEKRMNIKEALEHEWIKKRFGLKRNSSVDSPLNFHLYTSTGEI